MRRVKTNDTTSTTKRRHLYNKTYITSRKITLSNQITKCVHMASFRVKKIKNLKKKNNFPPPSAVTIQKQKYVFFLFPLFHHLFVFFCTVFCLFLFFCFVSGACTNNTETNVEDNCFHCKILNYREELILNRVIQLQMQRNVYRCV